MAELNPTVGNGTIEGITAGGVDVAPEETENAWFQVKNASIGATQLATNAVTTAKIAPLAVDTAELADSSVTSAKVGTNAIGPTKLADSAVTSVKIADLAVTTGKLGVDAVDGTKLADNAVDSEHITAGAVDTAHVGNAQITLAKQADLAQATVIGRASGAGTGVPTALTGAQVATISGALVGPASATDNAALRADTTTGKLAQNSGVLIDDNDNVTIPGAIKTTPLAVAYAASVALDVAEDNDFSIDALTGDVTISWTNPAAGRSGKIELLQDATGGRTLTINVPSGGSILRAYDSAGAAIPVSFPSTAANARVTVYYEFISATIVKLTPVRFGA